MRFPFLITGTALALGLIMGTSAQAHGRDARVWVSHGDIRFDAGRPFHRAHHVPLFVEPGRHGPRYYYYPSAYSAYPVAPSHYAPAPMAPYSYGPAYYPDSYRYLPPPPPRPRPRPGYHRHRPGY